MTNIITGLGPIQKFSRSIRGAQIAPRDRLPESFEDYIGNSTDPLVGFLEYLWDSVTGQRSANAANNANSLNLQKEMIYQTSEREAQNEHDEEMYNKYQSPEALFNAYRGIGVSAAGAASAILGNSPAVATANNAPSPSAAGASMANPNGLSAMASIIPAILQAPLWDAQARKTNEEADWIPIMNEAQLDKTYRDIDFIGFQMHLSEQELEISRSLAQSNIDLNYSEIELNFKHLEQIDADIKETWAEIAKIYTDIDFTKAATRTEYIKQFVLRTEAGKNIAETEESYSRTALNEQTEITQRTQADVNTKTADLLTQQQLTEEQRTVIEEANARLQQLSADASEAIGYNVSDAGQGMWSTLHYVVGFPSRSIQAAKRAINARKPHKGTYSSSMRSH